MTRINAAIPVKNLTDEHLRAEHREIKRLPALYKKRLDFLNANAIHKDFVNIPDRFSLGAGHVLFFLDKGFYTNKRFIEIHAECLRRNFKMTDFSENWNVYLPKDFNDWMPTETSKHLLIDRISERIENTKKELHYYGEKISKEKAKEILCQKIIHY